MDRKAGIAFILFTLVLTALVLASFSFARKPACNDKIDNDEDGFIDYPADPGCVNKGDNSEFNPSTSTTIQTTSSSILTTTTTIPGNTTCMDTDHGIDIFTDGYIRLSNGTIFLDYCYTDAFVNEFYCAQNTTASAVILPCPTGYFCNYAYCTPIISTSTIRP